MNVSDMSLVNLMELCKQHGVGIHQVLCTGFHPVGLATEAKRLGITPDQLADRICQLNKLGKVLQNADALARWLGSSLYTRLLNNSVYEYPEYIGGSELGCMAYSPVVRFINSRQSEVLMNHISKRDFITGYGLFKTRKDPRYTYKRINLMKLLDSSFEPFQPENTKRMVEYPVYGLHWQRMRDKLTGTTPPPAENLKPEH